MRDGERLTIGRVQFPIILQRFVVAPQAEGKRSSERRPVTVLCLYHDLVLFVTTHHDTFARQIWQVVIDVGHVDMHSARSGSRWLTLVSIGIGKASQKKTNNFSLTNDKITFCDRSYGVVPSYRYQWHR